MQTETVQSTEQADESMGEHQEWTPIATHRGGYAPERTRYSSPARREPSSTGLYDVLDLILDKGLVIDVWVRVSLVGIELLTIDLRVVIASVDTYLRYAEGAQRLQLYSRSAAQRLPDVVSGAAKKAKLGNVARNVGQTLEDKAAKVRTLGSSKGRQAGLFPRMVRAFGSALFENEEPKRSSRLAGSSRSAA